MLTDLGAAQQAIEEMLAPAVEGASDGFFGLGSSDGFIRFLPKPRAPQGQSTPANQPAGNAPPASGLRLIEGRIHVDADGNRARYLGKGPGGADQWETFQ